MSGFLDGNIAPPAGVLVTMGIIKVPEGTGTTVLYDPFGDPNADWWWYNSFLLAYDEAVTDAVAYQEVMAFRHTVDNKSMRKVPPDTELQMVLTNTTVDGARGVNVSYALRWLQGF